jgi:drug/metabolite transporter (DMT)-like permease
MITNNIKAILLSISAALSVSLMGLCVKLAAPYTSTGFVVFVRFGISLIYISIVLALKSDNGIKFFPKTKHLYIHVIRSFAAVFAMLMLYYSLHFISLVNANLLFMTNALFTPIFAWFFLKAKTNKKTWICISIAFVGVAFVLKPHADLFRSGSLFALMAGLLSAISYLAVRRGVQYDPPHTLMAYYFPIAFLISACLLPLHWKTPNLYGILLVLGVSVTGIFYQEFLVRAAQYAPAKIVSTLMYSSIIFSGLFDWFFWKHSLDMWSWLGIALVLLGSLALLTYAQPKNTNKDVELAEKKRPTDEVGDNNRLAEKKA